VLVFALGKRVSPDWSNDRARLAATQPVGREVVFYALATVVGSTAWLWPHLLRFRDVPDRGDPIFSAWRLARFAHQLVTDPLHLFDGNIFYPLPLTLTYSDPTVLQGLLGTPLIVAAVDPLIAANLLFFAAFPGCGLAFFYSAWRLTGDPRAAFIAGLSGAWYPFHSEHYSHFELQWFMFVPLALLGLLRLFAQPSRGTALAFGAVVAAQWLGSMYLGLLLVALLVPCAVTIMLVWQVRPSRHLVWATLIAVSVALPAFLLTGIPYWKTRHVRGERVPLEVSQGSATIADYLSTNRRMASYRWHSRADNMLERELFPGTSTLALAGIGLSPPWGASQIAIIVSGALAFDWSRGLGGLTYGVLYRNVAPFRGMRVPARVSAIVGSMLVLLGAFGTRRLLSLAGSATYRHVAAAVVAALVLIDLRMSTDLVGYWSTVPSLYRRVTSGMVLAELPRFHDLDYMYFSTRHWARLLDGYSGFTPDRPALHLALDSFPTPDGIERLRQLGATHLTYNCAFERSEVRCRHNLDFLDTNPSLELVAREVWAGAPVSLYRLR
jgi:hypothetical protein